MYHKAKAEYWSSLCRFIIIIAICGCLPPSFAATAMPEFCQNPRKWSYFIDFNKLEFIYKVPREILHLRYRDNLTSLLDFLDYWNRTYYTKEERCQRTSLEMFARPFSTSPFASRPFATRMLDSFSQQVDSAVKMANLLSYMFQNYRTEREESVSNLYNDAFYESLVRTAVENDGRILGVGIAFLEHAYVVPTEEYPHRSTRRAFCPYAYRYLARESAL